MKYISLLLTLCGFFFSSLFAQQNDFKITKHDRLSVKKISTVSPLEITEDWRPLLKNVSPPVSEEDFNLEQQAAQADYEKAIQNSSSTPNLRTEHGIVPTFYKGFLTNTRDTGFPNDNSLAVNKDGSRVVSVVNLDISAYTGTGDSLFSMSINSFTPNTGTNQKYDPRILFDAQHERFVFTCLNGFEPSKSRVIIAFSTTSNPEDPWNVYELDGNFELISQVDVWSDFPQCGLSRDELFISVNLFDKSAGAQDISAWGTGVWQIDLASGYAGEPLVVQPHSLQGTFSITPVHGDLEPYGPEFYFIDNNNRGQDRRIFIWEINNTIANNGSFSFPTTLTSSFTYQFPPQLVAQKGDSTRLIVLDSRVLSAYKHGRHILFAFAARGDNRRPAVFFGDITLSPVALSFSIMETRLIESDDYDLGYPSIAYGGCSTFDGKPSTFIMVNITSPDIFPGNAVFLIDTTGHPTEPTICVEGKAPLRRGSEVNLRWGDYTGISTNQPGEVWVAGYTTNEDGRNQTFVSQLFNEDCAEIPEPPSFDEDRVIPFPNPGTGDEISFKFEIAEEGRYTARVVDQTGRQIQYLIDEYLRDGEAVVGLSTLPLNNGVYFLVVEKNGARILTEKFVIAR
jgi:hypothetical protein